MTIHVHQLDGCAPTPLAHYLKALAILRLVSEQRDPGARGWWKGERFFLATVLSREDLLAFFVDEYRPTPILSPWNGGSGFYYRESKTKEKDPATNKLLKTGVRDAPTAATKALEELLSGCSPRLTAYRQSAIVAKAIVVELGLTEAPDKEDKSALIALLRSRVPLAGLLWLDAAVSSTGEDFFCAPLVGSGGNDGNEDFSKQFLERVLGLVSASEVARSGFRNLLEGALYGDPTPGALTVISGQFLPGANAGSNAGTGFNATFTGNPWDYVLGLEGALLFRGSASRRLQTSNPGAAFPFAVRVDAAGYSSAADSDRDNSRFEIWLPLWSAATSTSGVEQLLAEGRARVDGRDAQRSVDVARAVVSMGTTRGLTSFARTAFFTRNGNMHYSVPVGRWDIGIQPRAQLYQDIVHWVSKFRAVARERRTAKAFTSAARCVDEAMLGICRSAATPSSWQQLLNSLVAAESAVLRSPRTAADSQRGLSPLPPLRPEWIDAADDGSVEFRLAIALASQDAAFRSDRTEVFDNVRAHWMPIDRQTASRGAHSARRAARFATDANGLHGDPDVVCAGEDLERDLLALVGRRVQMASSLKARGLGLFVARGCGAGLGDVKAFLDGTTDDARILTLARALMAISWADAASARHVQSPSTTIDAAYALMRVTHLSEPLRRGGATVEIPLDSEPTARLASGDLPAAAAVALRRLRSSGLTATARVFAGSAGYARRLAASLAFPISALDASRCADLVTKPYLADPA